ncbi:MAG: 30s ribosomal protein S12 methylthiotransferase accessory protein YcaO, partial [Thauera sp.]|nr:30s ribosomal protein S12 methylthiotransferase accessory protein YcaO [Thauera sp.]
TDSKLADERPVAALIGLAPGSDPFWSELRVGELKTLLALVIGDVDAIIEGCEWIRQFNQLDADRRRVYRCIEALVNLDEHHEDSTGFEPALLDLYGEATLEQAMALLDGELRFFDQPSPGLDLVGCDMHQRLLAAYAKVQALK